MGGFYFGFFENQLQILTLVSVCEWYDEHQLLAFAFGLLNL